MPAEAIHLSALVDTRDRLDGEIARLIDCYPRHARLGAVLIDLPYFERFPIRLLQYVTKRSPAPSLWGDLFHREAPSRVGLELLRAARETASDPCAALALGYLSHAAVDRSIHPLVNRLARARAEALSSTEAAQHHEVEKFQSVLFHERRLGADRMGTRALIDYIDVDAAQLLADRSLRDAINSALQHTLGRSPTAGRWRSWARGYGQYVSVLGSPLGKLPAPPKAKTRERAPLYDDVGFGAAYRRAVDESVRDLTFAACVLENGRTTEEEWFAGIPEGSIDDPPTESA